MRGNIWLFSYHPYLKVPPKKKKEVEAVRLPSFTAMRAASNSWISLWSFFFFYVSKHNVCAICYYGRAEQTSVPTRVGEPACLASVHNWWSCCCVFDPAVWYVMPPALKLTRHWILPPREAAEVLFCLSRRHNSGSFVFLSSLTAIFRPCFSPGRLLAERWNANRRILNRITDSDSVALARCRWHYRGIAPESGKSNQAVTLPEGWRSSDCGMIHSNFLWSGRVMLRLPLGKWRQTEEIEPRRGGRHGAGVMQRR